MSARPDVTVVVPTHQRAHLLGRTLSSVLGQQDVDLELVVVVDGSTDGTIELLGGCGDDRVRVVENPTPLGPGSARNRGIEQAKGRWIAFLDDDDCWGPRKLRTQLDAVNGDDGGWIIGGAVEVDHDLRMLTYYPPGDPAALVESLPLRNAGVPAGASTALVQHELITSVGGFSGDLRHFADWDLWIRLSASAPPKIGRGCQVAYVRHAGNMSRDEYSFLAEVDVIEERYADLLAGRRCDRAYVHRWIARNMLAEQQRSEAMRHYLRAARDGDTRSIGRALIGAVWPRVAARQPLDEATIAGSEHYREAEAWLTPLRAVLR